MSQVQGSRLKSLSGLIERMARQHSLQDVKCLEEGEVVSIRVKRAMNDLGQNQKQVYTQDYLFHRQDLLAQDLKGVFPFWSSSPLFQDQHHILLEKEEGLSRVVLTKKDDKTFLSFYSKQQGRFNLSA